MPLRFNNQREAALSHAATLVAEAWQEFDRAREKETLPSDALIDGLASDLPEHPSDPIAGLDEAAEILDTSLAQSRPRYFAYIGSSGLEIGALADLLAHSYDINLALDAGAATLLERQAIRWLGDFLGYPAGVGFFTSGGTISNLTALAAARERALPGTRSTGLGNAKVAMYCSAEAHYSIKRAAEVLGFGGDAVRSIPIDAQRRMNTSDLSAAITDDRSAGVTPIAVIATAGTTLTGAVDPIRDIASIARQHDIWLHIDGAYGLPAASLADQSDVFDGLVEADSLSIDAHKWMFVPKACSAVLVKDPAPLVQAFGHNEAYIPHDDDEFNPVDATLEYSRPFRALKLWLAFKVHGAAAFREAIARNIKQAQWLYDAASQHPSFEVLPNPPQLSITPIRHLPDANVDVNQHNMALCKALQDDGRVYISQAHIDGNLWLRPCFTNYRTSIDDVKVIIDVIEEISNQLI